jgi:thiamine biosynthesis lipoprotein
MYRYVLFLLLGSLLFLDSRASHNSKYDWYASRRFLYDHIPVTLHFAPARESLGRELWSYLEQMGPVFNPYQKSGELARINERAAYEAVPLHPEIRKLLLLSRQLHHLTGGDFDVTVMPLVKCWKNAAKKGRLPSPEEIGRARAAVGLNKVHITNDKISYAKPHVELDFGGIAKGFFIDEVTARLRQRKIQSWLVQVGGEISVRSGPDGWGAVIGIQHPESPHRIWTQIKDPGTGLSVSTSGNYHRPLRIGPKKTLYHIFDPHAGSPVATSTLSATIVFPEIGKNAYADALSTTAVIMPPERFLQLARKLGAEALILQKNGPRIVEIKTPGWDRLVLAAPHSAGEVLPRPVF